MQNKMKSGKRRKQKQHDQRPRGAGLKASELVRAIERAGGVFEVRGRQVYAHKIAPCYKAALERSAYLVEAYVRGRS